MYGGVVSVASPGGASTTSALPQSSATGRAVVGSGVASGVATGDPVPDGPEAPADGVTPDGAGAVPQPAARSAASSRPRRGVAMDGGSSRRGLGQAATASGSGRPASSASSAALSVRSHGRSRSGRPKWPYAAVCR